MNSFKFLLLVILTGTFTPAQSEIYKWVDDNGETHYSGRMPDTETNVETIQPTALKSTGERETWQERNEDFAKRNESAAEQAKKDSEEKAHADKVQHACEQAKVRVTSLEPPRINKVDADGTRSRMSEEWRQEQLGAAREAVGKYCT